MKYYVRGAIAAVAVSFLLTACTTGTEPSAEPTAAAPSPTVSESPVASEVPIASEEPAADGAMTPEEAWDACAATAGAGTAELYPDAALVPLAAGDLADLVSQDADGMYYATATFETDKLDGLLAASCHVTGTRDSPVVEYVFKTH